MKQKFYLRLIAGVIVILGVTAFLSSTKENSPIQPQNENEVNFKLAAEEHNKGLDQMYGKLKEAKVKGQLNIELLDNILPFTEANTYACLKNSLAASENRKHAERSFKQEENKLNEEGTNEHNLWDASLDESLTPKQKELLRVLNDAINDGSLDLDATLSVFENVRIRANAECSAEERVALNAALDIGTSSLTYWNAHIEEWSELFSSESGKPFRHWFNWKAVGKADLMGAVAGAIGGGLAGSDAMI